MKRVAHWRKPRLEMEQVVFMAAKPAPQMQYSISAFLRPETDLVEHQLLGMLLDEIAESRGKMILHDATGLGDDRRGRRAIAESHYERGGPIPQRGAQPIVVRAVEIIRLLGTNPVHRRLICLQKLIEVSPGRVALDDAAGFAQLGDLRAVVPAGLSPDLLGGQPQIDGDRPPVQNELPGG